ncbi:hypothetical protein Cgig2_025555 [Carnegiea gigantea]|uniref:Uncharacterized protein n=1 Tax=Carnegiea gigantea TaxID=171969 RepID=A0A9Q1GKS8_9CARY|nr:hypothetical protein Cgig2_025555 [Carnegiea gigantea]
MTELEEFILRARTPLKRVRKVIAESTSDALIDDRTNKLKSRNPIIQRSQKDYTRNSPRYLLYFICLIMVCSYEENYTSVDRYVMRIAEPDLEIRDVQITINTDKGKAVVIESDKKHSEEPDEKKKTNKPLRKKAKRVVKYSGGVGKDDESVQKFAEKQTVKDSLVRKIEEKKMQNIAKKASSKHIGIEKSPKKP